MTGELFSLGGKVALSGALTLAGVLIGERRGVT
jgi:hypothetical protein